MASFLRSPGVVGVYVVLVLLLVIGGFLALDGKLLPALMVLGLATVLNVRILALRRRLPGGPGQ